MAPHFVILQGRPDAAMSTEKRALRASILAQRDRIDADAHARFASRLAAVGPRLVHDFAPPNQQLVVSLYAALGSEPDLARLAQALRDAGVSTALPVTMGRGERLVFRRWAAGDPTTAGRLRIEEPLPEAPVVEPDLLFVPLVAFDRRGHRIGYGAGNFDRTLADLRANKRIRAIGVGFADQEVLFVPSESHDQALDLIVTDRDTILCEA